MGISCLYPYPGEMLSSTVARIVKYTSLSLKQIDRLTGHHLRYRHNGAFCPELLEFFNEMLEDRISVMDLVYSNTIFPMVMPFASERTFEQYRQIENWPRTNKIDKESISISWRRARLKERLCFCQDCFNEQIKKYGETYWKLIWQIPLADVCEIHSCPLTETSLPANHPTKLPLPLETNKSMCRQLSVTEHSYMLTKTISGLLANRTLTNRNKWCDIIYDEAKNSEIKDLKIHCRNNQLFVTSKTLPAHALSYWGHRWLSKNYRQMLDRHCFKLGNYWLTYLVLIKAIRHDDEFPYI